MFGGPVVIPLVDDGLVVPFDGGYRTWRETVADGWTVQGAREQEASRLRPTAASRNGGRASPRHDTRKEPVPAPVASAAPAAPARPKPAKSPLAKLSKDAYRRQREAADAELTRLGLRKSHLELAMADPAVRSNFIELRRITSELADVEVALGAAEETWLAVEERAP
jgi:hypothetical protein